MRASQALLSSVLGIAEVEDTAASALPNPVASLAPLAVISPSRRGKGSNNEAKSPRAGSPGKRQQYGHEGWDLPEWAAPVEDTPRLELHGGALRNALARNLRALRPGVGKVTPREVKREDPLEEVDLLGGNGRWRQRKAEIEFEKRRIEDEERHREALRLKERERRKAVEDEERRRRQLQESERIYREEKERQKREVEEKERRRLLEEERERIRKEEEEKKKQAKKPKSCGMCGGDGKCKECGGRGNILSLTLAPKFPQSPVLAKGSHYGRMPRGCEACGENHKHFSGDLWRGSGICPTCDGNGLVKDLLDLAQTAVKPASFALQAVRRQSAVIGALSRDGGRLTELKEQ